MIVSMYKYSFLVHHLDFDGFIDDLKNLGVVHVIESERELSIELQDQLRSVGEISKILKQLHNYKDREHKNEIELPERGEELIELIKKLQDKLEDYTQNKSLLEKEERQLIPWGEFDWYDIEKLEKSGLDIRFFYCPARKYQANWEAEFNIGKISEERGFSYFVMLLENEVELPEIDADELVLPKISLRAVKAEINGLDQKIENLKGQMAYIASKGLAEILDYQLRLKEIFVEENVRLHSSNEVDGKIKILEGWVPDSNKKKVDSYLENQGVVYIEKKATEDDKPPILLKNNRFNKLFEIIGNLYSLPNYSELDLTPFLAPFYLLFFGFCFSDAGYGLLFLVVSTILKFKADKPQPVLSLIQLLGASTIFFGLLGGTFFGIELYNTGLPIYSSIADAYGSAEHPIGKIIQDVMFKASLALGLIQILFGMFLRAVKIIRQKSFKYAISTLSWAFLIIASIVNYAVVGEEGFMNVPYIVLGGLFLFGIFFLNTPGKNPFINFGAGLWDAYNTIVGGVGDLLSYVRLFALGLASAILGLVFNDLGLKLVNPEAGIIMQVLGYVFMLLVLIVGHAINIFMSGLGSMVHPLRLTFVEFYKNAGFEGGGKPYNPFREQTIEK